MRAFTAYFVGAGTIVAAIAIGLGGGLVAGNIMNPVAPKQGPDTSKVAQRSAAAATPAMTDAPSERVQYLTGTQAFGAIVAAPAQAEAKSDIKPDAKAEAKPDAKANAKTDAQSAQANAEPPRPSQAAAVEPPKPAPQPTKPVEQQASVEPSSSSDNAYAKARESDVKRAASERRRADRRERWAERRRYYDSRETRALRERPDWDDVARNIREDSRARDYADRPRGGFPQFRLFGADDD
jgi:hypothetical protein